MGEINVPAIATGAFLGFLALVLLVSCVPPITRFLGDLFCCPWRIPFTKKRRRNDDEEMDKDDLPYVVQTPRSGTPVDDRGYQRVSAAYMSAVSVVDPKAAKEELRRSAEYRREHSPYRNHDNHNYPHHNAAAYSGSHLQVPGPEMQHHYGHRPEYQRGERSWAGPSTERDHNYPPEQTYHSDGYAYGQEFDHYYGASDKDYEAYGQDYAVDVQRPQHAYSPPETTMHVNGHNGYFPEREQGHDFAQQQYPSSEPLVKPAAKLHKKSLPNI